MSDANDLFAAPELQSFRQEVRQFLTKHWLSLATTERKNSERAFRIAATEQGYLYRSVPRIYGGSEQPPNLARAAIIQEEFRNAKAPMEISGVGVGMLIPTLLACGNSTQKMSFIPKTLTGEYRWAQGYSEPNSGSDLASIRTRAHLQNGEWIINGQKIWSSGADKAQFMFLLARTEPDAKKHEGITYLLIDLRQPGISIRPIRQITGNREFCEVFFDDAKTPAEWTVGERGQGWMVSKTTLTAERSGFIGGVEAYLTMFDKLVELARTTLLDGKPAIDDPVIAADLCRLEGMITAHYHNLAHQFSARLANEDPGRLSLMNKLIVTKIAAQVAEIAKSILGDHFILSPFQRERSDGPEKWLNQYLGSLGLAIAGGTSNIQRNLVAERGYGLPRDPATATSA